MKAIVTSWIYPHEQTNNSDDRPKSIERISTSIEDLKRYMLSASRNFGNHVEWADSLFHLNLRDENKHLTDDNIEEFYGCNGFLYLEECLKEDSLGQCVARLYSKEEYKKEDARYFLFQVRNIH